MSTHDNHRKEGEEQPQNNKEGSSRVPPLSVKSPSPVAPLAPRPLLGGANLPLQHQPMPHMQTQQQQPNAFQPPPRVRSTPADSQAEHEAQRGSFFANNKVAGGSPAAPQQQQQQQQQPLLSSTNPLTKQNSGGGAGGQQGVGSAFKAPGSFHGSPSPSTSGLATFPAGPGARLPHTPNRVNNPPGANSQQNTPIQMQNNGQQQQGHASPSPARTGMPNQMARVQQQQQQGQQTPQSPLTRTSSNEGMPGTPNAFPRAGQQQNQQNQQRGGPNNSGLLGGAPQQTLPAHMGGGTPNPLGLQQQAQQQRGAPFLSNLPAGGAMSPALAGLSTPATPNAPNTTPGAPPNLTLGGAGLLQNPQAQAQGLLPHAMQQGGPQQQLHNPMQLQQAMLAAQQQQQHQQQLAALPPQLQASLMMQLGAFGGVNQPLNPAFLAAFHQQQQQQMRQGGLMPGMNRPGGGQPMMGQFNPQQLHQMQQQLHQMNLQQQQQNRHQMGGQAGPLAGLQGNFPAGGIHPNRPPNFGGPVAPGLGGVGPTFPPLGSFTPATPQPNLAHHHRGGVAGAPGAAGGINMPPPHGAPGVGVGVGVGGPNAPFNPAVAGSAPGLAASKSYPSFSPPVVSGGGLSAGPGALTASTSSSPIAPAYSRPPPPKPERKPLAIFDPETGEAVDFSSSKKDKQATPSTTPVPPAAAATAAASSSAATTSTLSATTSSVSPALSSTSTTSSASRPNALDLSDTDLTATRSERKPLEIISPTKFSQQQQQEPEKKPEEENKKEEANEKEAVPATTASQDAAASTTSSTLAPSTSSTAISSLSSSSSSAATTTTPSSSSSSSTTDAAASSSSSAASTDSSASSSSLSSTLSPSPPVPYSAPAKRPLMSLSPQPGAGSGLAPSTSSDSISSQRAGSVSPQPTAAAATAAASSAAAAAAATPATAASAEAASSSTAPSSASPSPAPASSAEKAATDSASAEEKKSEEAPRSRGPILPLSGAAAPMERYRPKALRALKEGAAASTPASTAGESASSAAATSTSAAASTTSVAAATPAAAAPVSSSTPDASKYRDSTGRLVYDRDFLMSFSHITEKPFNFPAHLQPEIEAKAVSSSSLRAGAASPAGAPPSKKEDKWARGQQLPITPLGPQDVRSRGASMAPQGGRGAFALAQQSAVRADQQRSRETASKYGGGGGAGGMDRDRDRDRDRRDSRDMRGGPKGGGGARGERGDRDGGRGSSRGGGQPSDYLGPVAPLQKSANRWVPGTGVNSEMDRIKKKVQGLLNKLSLDRFDTLTSQLTDLIVEHKSEGVPLLSEVVSIVFDKALSEVFFSSMYADLCVRVSEVIQSVPEFEPEMSALLASDAAAASAQQLSEEELEARRQRQARTAKKSPFRVLLLHKCQLEFEAGLKPVDPEGKSAEEVSEVQGAQKRRFLGLIKFVGELFKKGMLLEKIMHQCIAHLIGDIAHPVEEDLEAVCNLLTTIGHKIDHEKAKPFVDSFFQRVEMFSQMKSLSSRIRFMCLDLIDLRKSAWQSRRKPQEVKSLEAVRKEAAQEQMNKAAASARAGYGRGPASNPMISLRPASMMGGIGARGGVGSQDVRSTVKRDRYASLAKPTTPAAAPAPAAPAAKVGAPTPAAAAPKKTPSPPPAAAPVSAEKASSIIRSMLQEYGASSDLSEAKAAISDLHAPSLHHLVVSEALTKGLNEHKVRSALTHLCVELFKEGLLVPSDFEAGITSSLSHIDADFIMDDMPKAAEFIGHMLGVWVEARCVDLNILTSATTHLQESGEAIQIFIHTAKVVLDRLKEDEAATRSIIESQGIKITALMGLESEEENVKEWGREVSRKEFLKKLYPTAEYELEVRQVVEEVMTALQSDANTPALSKFAALLTTHSGDFENVNFLRSVVESILTVVLPRTAGKEQQESNVLRKLFANLHANVPFPTPAAAAAAAQHGILHTCTSFVHSRHPSGSSQLLQRLFSLLLESGLLSDKSSFKEVEQEARQWAISTPSFIDAIQAVQ